MPATTLCGVARAIGSINGNGRLDLRWSKSEVHCPSITHGPRGSVLSFSLAPVTEDTYRDLATARRYGIPVRLASLDRPLNLVIDRLKRLGEEVEVSGWIVPYRAHW